MRGDLKQVTYLAEQVKEGETLGTLHKAINLLTIPPSATVIINPLGHPGGEDAALSTPNAVL